MDTWGNVKSPAIEKVELVDVSDQDGWFDVYKGNTAYSSLIVERTAADSVSSFTLESYLLCSEMPKNISRSESERSQ